MLLSLILLLEKIVKTNQIFKEKFALPCVLYYSNSISLNSKIEEKTSSLSQFIW